MIITTLPRPPAIYVLGPYASLGPRVLLPDSMTPPLPAGRETTTMGAIITVMMLSPSIVQKESRRHIRRMSIRMFRGWDPSRFHYLAD